jgi:flagella basal body P-ring formation protein FlgA
MKSKVLETAVPLPLFSRLTRRWGSAVSPSGRFSVLLLALACTGAMAQEPLDRQIDQTVHDYFTGQLADKTVTEGWQGARFTQKIFALPEHSPAGPCSQPLQVQGTEPPWPGYGRLRLTLACPDQPQWSVQVTAQATVFTRAVVAAEVLERGQLISPAMLAYQEVALSRQSRGLFSHIEEVAGLSAKRRTRSQQMLTRDMLVSPWLVRRGERVTVTANHGDIRASTEGEALQDGRKGTVIRVRNAASGKVIEAKVTAAGAVSSTFQRPDK